MGYPVAYRTAAARASSQGRARASPLAANDNRRLPTPPQPANDNYRLPGRVRVPVAPTPANDNAARDVLKGSNLSPRGLNVRQLRKIRTVVRAIDPVGDVLFQGLSSVLNMIPGFAKDMPREEWGQTNNYKLSLPLAKRWDNRSEFDLQQETAASLPTRLTGQASTGKPTIRQDVGAGQYLSTYHIYWVGSPLFTYRRDETADYGPAPADMICRNRIVNISPDGVPVGLTPEPLPYVLLPFRRPAGWPQEWGGGYQTPSPPIPSPVPAVKPQARPRPRPQPEPRPEPQPPLKPWPPLPFPPGKPPELWWPPTLPKPPVVPGVDPPVVVNPPVAPPTGPLVPRRPAGPRVKERKTRAQKALIGLLNALGDITEWADVLDAFYDALPEGLKKKGRANEVEKAKAVYQHFNQIDLDTAIFNAAFSQAADLVWAKLGVKYPGRYGGAMGANRILSKAYGPDVRKAIDAVHDHAVKIINAATGLTIQAK